MNKTPKIKMAKQQNQPTAKIRIGAIQATIWENQTTNGAWEGKTTFFVQDLCPCTAMKALEQKSRFPLPGDLFPLVGKGAGLGSAKCEMRYAAAGLRRQQHQSRPWQASWPSLRVDNGGEPPRHPFRSQGRLHFGPVLAPLRPQRPDLPFTSRLLNGLPVGRKARGCGRMISVITTEKEAILSVRVRGPDGQEAEVEAVIDTGFNGFLTLSTEIDDKLALPFAGSTSAALGDGAQVYLDLFEATILWKHGVLLWLQSRAVN